MTLLEDGLTPAKPKRRFKGRAGTFDWTVEAIDRLRTLVAAGATGTEIAAEIGCSRNGAIGKWHRLGLPHPNAARQPARVSKPAPDRGGGTKQRIAKKLRIGSHGWPTLVVHKPVPVRAPESEPASLGLSLLDLTDHTCRWPHGEEPPFEYCGHPTEKFDRPYCAFHNRLGAGRQIAPQYSEAEVERRRRRAIDHLNALYAARARQARR